MHSFGLFDIRQLVPRLDQNHRTQLWCRSHEVAYCALKLRGDTCHHNLNHKCDRTLPKARGRITVPTAGKQGLFRLEAHLPQRSLFGTGYSSRNRINPMTERKFLRLLSESFLYLHIFEWHGTIPDNSQKLKDLFDRGLQLTFARQDKAVYGNDTNKVSVFF